MAKSKQLTVENIDKARKEMEDRGYSPDAVDKFDEGAADIEPGQDYPEYNNLIFIAVMPDDSSSIAGANSLQRDNTQDVIDGHNGVIDALKKSQQVRMILFKTQYLNSDTALNNWVQLDKAVPMTRENYRPEGGTPLYDKTLSLLRSVIYETQEALERGQQARWGILLITDGDDTASKDKAEHVKLILDDMRKTGELLQTCEPSNQVSGSIALLGLEDRETDPQSGAHFEKVAHSMGIEWVLHADRVNPKSMRRAFNTFSGDVAKAASAVY
jgi:hypothetical protein